MKQGVSNLPEGLDDALVKIFQFLNTISRWIGGMVAKIIHGILPSITIPNDLTETIGLLSMLTIFLVIVQIAKKLTWIIVIIGWVLVIIRLVMIIVQGA